MSKPRVQHMVFTQNFTTKTYESKKKTFKNKKILETERVLKKKLNKSAVK